MMSSPQPVLKFASPSAASRGHGAEPATGAHPVRHRPDWPGCNRAGGRRLRHGVAAGGCVGAGAHRAGVPGWLARGECRLRPALPPHARMGRAHCVSGAHSVGFAEAAGHHGRSADGRSMARPWRADASTLRRLDAVCPACRSAPGFSFCVCCRRARPASGSHALRRVAAANRAIAFCIPAGHRTLCSGVAAVSRGMGQAHRRRPDRERSRRAFQRVAACGCLGRSRTDIHLHAADLAAGLLYFRSKHAGGFWSIRQAAALYGLLHFLDHRRCSMGGRAEYFADAGRCEKNERRNRPALENAGQIFQPISGNRAHGLRLHFAPYVVFGCHRESSMPRTQPS